MRSVNIAELKQHLSSYLKEVRAGKEIIIRDRNTPIARLVPLNYGDDQEAELLELAAQGKIRLGEGNGLLDESFWDLPKPRVPMDVLQRIIKEERDE
ncbi:MAG: type II toxin-antitoxin system Phd/YefM family antitoxin [Blastocatellia bacterium]